MNKIGLIYNPRLDTSLPLAQDIASWLAQRGVDAWICSTHERPDDPQCISNTDLLVTLGGDGTILRAMPLAVPLEIPVLGLNLGRVGFLTECAPERWERVLERILAGQGEIEERTMLQVTLCRDEEMVIRDLALNDAVVNRHGLARTVRLATSVDGALAAQYIADGLIIATATGSTAYSYAVGGPILPPWLDNFVVVPVAAHLTLDRPLVLDGEAVVEVEVHTTIPGMLSVDGRPTGDLHEGDCVTVERSRFKARFLRLRSRNDFYRTLVERLSPRNHVDVSR
ncbi:MAG: NAD(+)/NADH kinase [Anaerolineae bacterium]|nr:NAD(+)/NADH kinase [Anaerolineae bacterium]